MPINPNNTLKALHCCYTAMTGGGKGVALQFAGFIPKKPHLALFDPYREYEFTRGDRMSGFGGRKVHHYSTRRGFAAGFKAAWMSGKPFMVAYSPPKPSRDEMLWFCSLMWAAGDGNRRLDVVIEELAKWSLGAGAEPAESPLGEIATGGRKFGLVLHVVFQTPSEVSKSITKQMPYKVVGPQEALIECKRMAGEIDKDPVDIGKLESCTYWVKKPGWGNVAFLDLRSEIETRLK